MVSIYRDESAKIKAIDNYSLTSDTGTASNTAGLKMPKDDDEGDFD
jgi:hypothetical protein